MRRLSRYGAPFVSMAIAAVLVFLLELVSMYVVEAWVFKAHGSNYKQFITHSISDSLILTLIFTPVLYILFYKPMVRKFEEARRADMEKELLIKEIHHRVKNNMQVISSLLSLQSLYIEDKKYAKMFHESQGRIKAMAMVHEKLYQQEQFASIDVADYIKSLSDGIAESLCVEDTVKFDIDIEPMKLDLDLLIPCGLLVNELLTNAIKHAFDGVDSPEIIIRLGHKDDEMLYMTIADNGKGLTGGMDSASESGIGLNLVKTLVTQIDGVIDVRVTEGTEFTMVFKKEIDFAGRDEVG